MQDLKNYLLTREDIQDVYLNDKGQWCFSPNNAFPIHKTREDILAMEPEETSEEREAREAAAAENITNTTKKK